MSARGVAFTRLLREADGYRYGIEIDANRAQQARSLGIETLQANVMDVRCSAESISLLYLNPPYDLESGQTNNQRLGKTPQTHQLLRDSEVLNSVRCLEMLAWKPDLADQTDHPPVSYEVPPSGPVVITNTGIPLDEVEDLLLDSAAYRQASRILLPK